MLRSMGQRIPTLPVGKWSYGTCYPSKAKKLSFPVRITVPKAEETQSAPSVTVMETWDVVLYSEQWDLGGTENSWRESPCGKADSRVRHQRAEKRRSQLLVVGARPMSQKHRVRTAWSLAEEFTFPLATWMPLTLFKIRYKWVAFPS